MKKRTKQSIVKILAVIGIWSVSMSNAENVLTVQAAEAGSIEQSQASDGTDGVKITEPDQLMKAERDIDMKAAPEEDAETLMSYEKGDSVFVTGETADGWYRVIYQDKEGYVPKGSLSIQEIDVGGLDVEMAQMEEEAKFVVESVERYRVEARRSKIWGSIIVTLVVGIFAIGIISGIRGERGQKKKEGNQILK